MRLSCQRTGVVGYKKPDWTNQSARRNGRIGGTVKEQIKVPRKKCLKNQVLISGFDVQEGVTIKQVEPLRMHNDDGVAVKEVYIGVHNGRRVERKGYVYGMVSKGKTPGRWYYA
ncbi:MAG: hypothetical protein KJO69_10290 [Gammaproteobacteria bacterium]|nr:hypothetical protein [Gammaproteobacteria bacterium]